MKITERQLRRIIKEELTNLKEQDTNSPQQDGEKKEGKISFQGEMPSNAAGLKAMLIGLAKAVGESQSIKDLDTTNIKAYATQINDIISNASQGVKTDKATSDKIGSMTGKAQEKQAKQGGNLRDFFLCTLCSPCVMLLA